MATMFNFPKTVKFGADPELATTYFQNGKDFVLPPAFFRTHLGVPVTWDPEKPTHPIFLEGDGYFFHEDGPNFELAIKPQNDPVVLFENIQRAYAHLYDFLSPFSGGEFEKVNIIPTTQFDCDRWAKEGKEFQQTLIFGCDPDKDAFNMEKKEKVLDVSKHPQRYCGGHIHMSGHEVFSMAPVFAIKCLATTAGLSAVGFSDRPELDRDRSWKYGLPGKFRIQEYKNGEVGVEYRTPSNRWTGSFQLFQKVFEGIEVAFRMFEEPEKAMEFIDLHEYDICRSIIEINQGVALDLLAQVKAEF